MRALDLGHRDLAANREGYRLTRLYLVRHGETIWNREIRIQGHKDIPLSPFGERQSAALAARLACTEIDAAYASDLQRAVVTASILLGGRDLVAQLRPALREAAFGTWEGLTYEEVKQAYPEEYAGRRLRPAEVAPSGGETLSEMVRRVQQVIDNIVLEHPDQSVLVVSHGGPLRVLLGILLGLGLDSYWKVRVDNCSLSIVDTYPEGNIVSLLNDTCHLLEVPHGGDVP